MDCDCDGGLIAFTVAFVNRDVDAESVTIWLNRKQTIEACAVASGLSYGNKIVCALQVDHRQWFRHRTYFTIEYDDDSMEDCEGYFDTSCKNSDLLGDFGGGSCSDLVVTSWTDEDYGTCTGNVSYQPMDSASNDLYYSDSSNNYDDSYYGNGRWARQWGGAWAPWYHSHSSDGDWNGDSESDDDSSDESWFEHKKCVPSCADWGAQRGLECACYESCTANGLDAECTEGTTAGYCGTGKCCCGGNCKGDSCDSSSSSSGRRLLGSERCWDTSYDDWFKDRCNIDEEGDDGGYVWGSDSNSDYDSSDRRRRRQLLGATFGSARRLQSSDSSDGWNYPHPDFDDFLVETCIEYAVTSLGNSNCFDVVSIFLPLCENNQTDFNSSNLNEDDLTGLITEETFADGTNVERAIGTFGPNGKLGIEVVLSDDAVSTFQLCLGNVTVDGNNVNDFNVTTIDTSSGVIVVSDADDSDDDDGDAQTQYLQNCTVDGLPCFSLVHFVFV